MALLSGDKRFLWGAGVKRQLSQLVENGNFQRFRWLFLRNFIADVRLHHNNAIRYTQSVVRFSGDPKMHGIE